MHNDSPTVDIQMVSIDSSAVSFFFIFVWIYHLFLQRFTQNNVPSIPETLVFLFLDIHFKMYIPNLQCITSCMMQLSTLSILFLFSDVHDDTNRMY